MVTSMGRNPPDSLGTYLIAEGVSKLIPQVPFCVAYSTKLQGHCKFNKNDMGFSTTPI